MRRSAAKQKRRGEYQMHFLHLTHPMRPSIQMSALVADYLSHHIVNIRTHFVHVIHRRYVTEFNLSVTSTVSPTALVRDASAHLKCARCHNPGRRACDKRTYSPQHTCFHITIPFVKRFQYHYSPHRAHYSMQIQPLIRISETYLLYLTAAYSSALFFSLNALLREISSISAHRSTVSP